MFLRRLISKLIGNSPLGLDTAPKFEHPARGVIPPEIEKFIKAEEWNKIHYPPFKDGFPGPVTGETLLHTFHQDLINRIRSSIGLPAADFEQYVEPILVNFAEIAHLLPASEGHHHCGQGGLMRHSMEVAALTLDACLTTAFDTSETPSRRSMRLRRWYVAGVAAGLLHDTGKTLTDVTVRDFSGNLEWDGKGSIYKWVIANKLPRYFITWNEDRHERHKNANLYLMSKVIPEDVIAWIRQGGSDIFNAMSDAIAGSGESKDPLVKAVKWADSTSVKRDLIKGPRGSSTSDTGVPVVRLLIDTMQQLVSSESWTANKPGSRVWVTPAGIFLPWNNAVDELISALQQQEIGGFPRSPDALITMLAEQGAAERTDDGEVYWYVAPLPLHKNGKTPILRCMKVASADLLYPYIPAPAPVSCHVGREGEQIAYITSDDKLKLDIQQILETPAEPASPAPSENIAPETPEVVTEAPPTQQAPSLDSASAAAPTPPPKTPPSVPTLSPAPSQDAAVADSSPAQPGEAGSEDDAPSIPAEPESAAEYDRDDFLQGLLQDMNPIPQAARQEPSEPAQEAIKPKTKPSLADILGEPVSPAATTKKARPSLDDILNSPASQSASESESEPVAVPESSAEPEPAPALDVAPPLVPDLTDDPRWLLVVALKAQLAPDDIALLDQQPRLALALAASLQNTANLRYAQGKIFFPFSEAGFDLSDLDDLKAAGWVWQDFTAEDDGYTRKVFMQPGFILAQKLCELIVSAVELDLPIRRMSTVSEDKLDQYREAAKLACERGRLQTLNRVPVLIITPSITKSVAEAIGLEREEVEDAVHLLRDSVAWAAKKQIVVRANPEEYGERR